MFEFICANSSEFKSKKDGEEKIQLTKNFIVSVDGNGKLIYTSYKDAL